MEKFFTWCFGKHTGKFFTTLKNDNLCPVIFSSWGSFINIMPYCYPITIKEFNLVLSDKNDSFVNLPVEKKITSFGKLNKKIVAVDYGS